ncbi:MAG TPA: biotin/lipoyl-binding protein [Ignavibacteriales bacterium]|nr:biotin/lipoyl-binding protein [Ignavibacteriales bacterium]HOL81913.1 biotin/lipoyl-binding protein [Ignavibacteriales bacterium]HOM65963.1 biotin/lipoyl-binding protein [Ignavibacteriales bacterium]HPD67495.1 biotin/lipoyl-binding protein [Ignavibacteriales bacterium]HPP34050.1 biotin/lipoyl-binding protein [Ignavibacteriales bacterium]
MKKLRIKVDGKVYEVEVELLEDTDSNDPYFHNKNVAMPSMPQVVPQQQIQKSLENLHEALSGKTMLSPLNGVVVEVCVKPGDTVKVNDTLVVVEAMKMKTNIASKYDGEIESINVKQGDRIEAGQPLVTYK